MLKVAQLKFSPLSPELVPYPSPCVASLFYVFKRARLQPPWKMIGGGAWEPVAREAAARTVAVEPRVGWT